MPWWAQNLFTVGSDENLLNYDFFGAKRGRPARWKSQMIILCKWRRKLYVLFQCFRFCRCHDRCLSFLSILMKIICKQSFVFHSENCFFIVDFSFQVGNRVMYFDFERFSRQINMILCRHFSFFAFLEDFFIVIVGDGRKEKKTFIKENRTNSSQFILDHEQNCLQNP